MGQRSSIEQLPQELFDAINEALGPRKMTIAQVVDHMRALGADLSMSAVGRHKRKIDQVAARIRKSRTIAEAMNREFGDEPDDKMSRVNIELLHDQIMRMISADEGDTDDASMDDKQLRNLSDALYRLASARKLDTERLVKERKDVAERASKLVSKELAKTPGISKDTVDDIKRRILGIAGP